MRNLVFVIFVAFAAVSAVALWQHGYWGIFSPLVSSWAGGQVLADLAIALTLVMSWVWRDARTHGRNPWPWLLGAVALGSFSPLVYLLTRQPTRSA